MKNKPMKTYTLEEVKNKLVGKKGTARRNQYELELNLDLLGEMIKTVRKERHLTQDQLGKLVGVQKSQISKLENNTTDVRLDTILRIFSAMKANVQFNVKLEEGFKKEGIL
jgi:HTH-type transcriptional regulator / antitoxin HipB